MTSILHRASLLFSFLLLPICVFGIRVAPGSPCTSSCQDSLDDSTQTAISDLTCQNEAYSESVSGVVWTNCLTCLQSSTYASGGETDQEWFLYNLRLDVAYCVFGYNNSAVVTSPCTTSEACGPLAAAIEDGNLDPSNLEQYSYCSAGGNAMTGPGYQQCLACVDAEADTGFTANYLVALEAACEQQPAAGQTVSLSDSIFSSELISATSQATITPTSGAGASGLTTTTIIIISVASSVGLLLLLLSVAAAILYIRRRHRQTPSSDVKAPSSSHLGLGLHLRHHHQHQPQRDSDLSFKCLSPKRYPDSSSVSLPGWSTSDTASSFAARGLYPPPPPRVAPVAPPPRVASPVPPPRVASPAPPESVRSATSPVAPPGASTSSRASDALPPPPLSLRRTPSPSPSPSPSPAPSRPVAERNASPPMAMLQASPSMVPSPLRITTTQPAPRSRRSSYAPTTAPGIDYGQPVAWTRRESMANASVRSVSVYTTSEIPEFSPPVPPPPVPLPLLPTSTYRDSRASARKARGTDGR